MVRSLSNEVMRRLANMSSHMRTSEKVKVMDDFSQVMVNSGHVIKVVQRALMNGMKGHLRKMFKRWQRVPQMCCEQCPVKEKQEINSKTKLV